MPDRMIITINKPALKKKWDERKGKILGTALVLTATFAILERIAVKQHDQFLKEHDLYDEYYSMDWDTDPEAE